MNAATAWLKGRSHINKLSPTATILLVALVAALAIVGCTQALKAVQPQVTILQGGPQAGPTVATTPAAPVLVPLEAEQMPPVSPEARRLIKVNRETGGLDPIQANDLWRQMSPPFAPPGVNLCSWQLTVDRATGYLVAVPEGKEGVPLFDQEVPPCAAGDTGAAQAPTNGTLPSVSVPGSASGGAR